MDQQTTARFQVEESPAEGLADTYIGSSDIAEHSSCLTAASYNAHAYSVDEVCDLVLRTFGYHKASVRAWLLLLIFQAVVVRRNSFSNLVNGVSVEIAPDVFVNVFSVGVFSC